MNHPLTLRLIVILVIAISLTGCVTRYSGGTVHATMVDKITEEPLDRELFYVQFYQYVSVDGWPEGLVDGDFDEEIVFVRLTPPATITTPKRSAICSYGGSFDYWHNWELFASEGYVVQAYREINANTPPRETVFSMLPLDAETIPPSCYIAFFDLWLYQIERAVTAGDEQLKADRLPLYAMVVAQQDAWEQRWGHIDYTQKPTSAKGHIFRMDGQVYDEWEESLGPVRPEYDMSKLETRILLLGKWMGATNRNVETYFRHYQMRQRGEHYEYRPDSLIIRSRELANELRAILSDENYFP